MPGNVCRRIRPRIPASAGWSGWLVLKKLPRSQFWRYHWAGVWPWPQDLTSPGLSFPIYKIRMMIFQKNKINLFILHNWLRTSLTAQWVKNPPAMQETQETWVWFLGWVSLLKEGMAAHSSILACRIPRTEEPGRLQSAGSLIVRHDWVTNTFTFYFLAQLSVVQSLSRARLFVTPRTAARQACLSFTLPEFARTHVRWVSDAVQASSPL